MTIVLHRHRRDEETLLAPAARSNGPAPVERPRGVEPARLGCAPGTSRAVVDELTAQKLWDTGRAEAARLPLMPFRPVGPPPSLDKLDGLLAEMRAELDDWDTVTDAIEHKTLLVVVDATRELDLIANGLTFAQHMLWAPLFEEMRDVERELVDAVAEWILAEVAIEAELFGAEETGAVTS